MKLYLLLAVLFRRLSHAVSWLLWAVWRDGFRLAGEQGSDHAQGFDLLPYPLQILFFLLQDLVNISHDVSRYKGF